jgi:uncharacterized protein
MFLQAQSASLPLDGRERVPAMSLRGTAGTSFKPEHAEDIFTETPLAHWFEVHAENYMMPGGPRLRMLERIRADFPLSLHGVGMSIGGTKPLDLAHLKRFAALVNRFAPALVSEHLAWSSHGTAFYNDLLPLPYDRGSLSYVSDHIDQAQEALRRPILIENPATYVTFTSSTMTEVEFLRATAKRTGCGLLLDINNVLVSSTNHGFSASGYLDEFPIESVGEIHLAGHSEQLDDQGAPLLIDSHDRQVAHSVWRLYERVIRKHGPLPTLIEWDSRISHWRALRQESRKAQAILNTAPSRWTTSHVA